MNIMTTITTKRTAFFFPIRVLMVACLTVGVVVTAFNPLHSNSSPLFRQSNTFYRIPSRTVAQLSTASNTNELTPLSGGSYVALVTPFTSTGAIDLPSLRRLLSFHLSSSTDGLCILGTTGEATTLTLDERRLVLSTAVSLCKGRLPLLVGTGTVNPTSVREQTLQAKDEGGDGVLVVTPYYVKPPQRGLVRHYLDVADLGMPTVVYNVPGRTGVDMTPESIGLVAGHENVVGVKEATGDVSRVKALREHCGEDFLLYSGDDGTAADFRLAGGDGCISVTANVAPLEMHRIMTEGAEEESVVREINERLDPLHGKLFVESNPIPAKWAAKRMGLIESAFCRPPLCELDAGLEGVVEDALRKADLI